MTWRLVVDMVFPLDEASRRAGGDRVAGRRAGRSFTAFLCYRPHRSKVSVRIVDKFAYFAEMTADTDELQESRQNA